MRRIRAVVFAITLIALCGIPAFGGNGGVRTFENGVKDKYIVRLADTLPAEQVRALAAHLARQHGGKLGHVFEAVVPGFAITLPEGAAEALSHHPMVEYVEQSRPLMAAQVQQNAPFHLDRIDHRTLAELDGRYDMYCNSTPVYAYVVDTGIRATHQEFWTNSVNPTSRVVAGKTLWAGESNAAATNPCGGSVYDGVCSSNDPNCLNGGHGTAVASVLGGLKYGVAKHVSFIAVRALNCSGVTWPEVVARAAEWIYNDKPTRLLPSGQPAPAVANLSFGGPIDKWAPMTFEEEWITRLVTERNITVVAAATNYDKDVSEISPARLSRSLGGKVITVGGTTTTDRRWKCNSANPWESCNTISTIASGWGPLDIFAPAQNISSAGIKSGGVFSDTAERQANRSGTSFAAPIVAGIAAIHLIGSGSTRTPDQIWSLIQTQASGDWPSTPPAIMPISTDANSAPLNGSPNRFIYRLGSTRCRL